jgi:N6-adenosine-specific RNA methylase IME4
MIYRVIVADPPWNIKKLTHRARPNQIAMDYPVMTSEAIKALPVANVAADDCWLFLWTIQKYLFEAKAILEAWGFQHLCVGVWEKTYGRSAGMPLYGFRWNAEFYLVGYKRKPPLWPERKLMPLVFQAPNIHHSQKPEQFQDMVELVSPGPYLELFARRKRPGWDCVGQDLTGQDIQTDLRALQVKLP